MCINTCNIKFASLFRLYFNINKKLNITFKKIIFPILFSNQHNLKLLFLSNDSYRIIEFLIHLFCALKCTNNLSAFWQHGWIKNSLNFLVSDPNISSQVQLSCERSNPHQLATKFSKPGMFSREIFVPIHVYDDHRCAIVPQRSNEISSAGTRDGNKFRSETFRHPPSSGS